MTIFEVEKDLLLQLSHDQLEELVARLAEAEISANGGNLRELHWAGSISAPDGGVDVRVAISNGDFRGDFIPRPNTIFQVKRPKMKPSEIKNEMRPNDNLASSISDQASKSGAYIIVSLSDDCAEPERRRRLGAMLTAVEDDPNRDSIILDFYDRSKLHQWLRQYPSVILWVRTILGIQLSGWKSYGRWSNPPKDQDDSLILAPGVFIRLPRDPREKLSLQDALVPVRELIQSSNKSIRVAGLSGVGKTRFVQALFDESLDTQALDRTLAIYVDIGDDPEPSARDMVDRLIEENRPAVVVLDNCPSNLHSSLSTRVAGTEHQIKLITVEYDIRENRPQTTEVILIEAEGPDIAEQLLLRRFPSLGHINARKIAEFANGNARVSLAVAERVESGESLGLLSDADLFDRLFQQRNEPNNDLRVNAEALSLVYSFSVVPDEEGVNELQVIGSLCGSDYQQLYRSSAELLSRQIAQKRGHWRAILPHAIANNLASFALNNIPVEILRSTFEHPGRERLLNSFGHRLGLLHEHPIAQEIVRSWLSEKGTLSRILELNENSIRLLDFVAPVAPELILERLEVEIKSPEFQGLDTKNHRQRSTVLGLLSALAYQPENFDRSIQLLLRVAEKENHSNSSNNVQEKVLCFFQAYLSGTHATPNQRAEIIRRSLSSGEPIRTQLGLEMLSTTLESGHWMGRGAYEFGARPRDYGYNPNYHQLVEWYQFFIGVAEESASNENSEFFEQTRTILAQQFRGLWRVSELRPTLLESAQKLNSIAPWSEGWVSVRSTLCFDYCAANNNETVPATPSDLIELEKLLYPQDLLAKIKTFVLGLENDTWSLDVDFNNARPEKHAYAESERRLSKISKDLGEAFAGSGISINTLCPRLFSEEWMPYRGSFGEGLALGAQCKRIMWSNLRDEFVKLDENRFNYLVLSGFISQVAETDIQLSRSILDQCLESPLLRKIIVGLHPTKDFGEEELNRCMEVLTDSDADLSQFGSLFWQEQYEGLPKNRVVDLARKIISKNQGRVVLLDAFSIKLNGKDSSKDVLGLELRQLGLIAATECLINGESDHNELTDYHLKEVIRPCLGFPGNDRDKEVWIDSIFSVIEDRYGLLHSYREAIQTTASILTEDFLEKAFHSHKSTHRKKKFFQAYGSSRNSPLSKIDPARLIEWCKSKNEPELWLTIANCIYPFKKDNVEKAYFINPLAMKFLESAPHPYEVLSCYAQCVGPMSWSGSRAFAMERRAKSFEALREHENPAISKASSLVLAEIGERIATEREREKQYDEANEQRFE